MPGLRIAMVTPRELAFMGGVELHVGRISELLVERGHSVELFTQRTEPGGPSHEWRNGVLMHRHRGIAGRRAYPVSPALWGALYRNRDRFDVIHAHMYHALAGLPAPLLRGDRRALVFTTHYHATGHTPLAMLLHAAYRPIGRRMVQAADRVICVSEAEAGLVRRDFVLRDGAHIAVIPNGVDRDAICATAPRAATRPLVLCVGRLVRYKNVATLIAAAKLLSPDIAVEIIGDGPDRHRLEALAEGGGGAEVIFRGRVSDEELREALVSAGVVVSLSSQEAFGLTLAEGIAAGARVVASSIPAHREVGAFAPAHVDFVPVQTPPPLVAQAIRRALAEGRLGRSDAHVPSWTDVAAATEGVYLDALGLAPRVSDSVDRLPVIP